MKYKGVWNHKEVYHQIPLSQCFHKPPLLMVPTPPHDVKIPVQCHSLLPLMSDESLTIFLGKLAQHDVYKSSISRATRLTHIIITSVIVTLDHSLWESAISHLWKRW